MIIIIHSTFKNPPPAHHLLIRLSVGPGKESLSRSWPGGPRASAARLITPNKKSRWGRKLTSIGKLGESELQASGYQNQKLLLKSRLVKRCESPESPGRARILHASISLFALHKPRCGVGDPADATQPALPTQRPGCFPWQRGWGGGGDVLFEERVLGGSQRVGFGDCCCKVVYLSGALLPQLVSAAAGPVKKGGAPEEVLNLGWDPPAPLHPTRSPAPGMHRPRPPPRSPSILDGQVPQVLIGPSASPRHHLRLRGPGG